MTREEAIKILKSKMDGHTDTSYEWAETVRMAIKALKQEPCDDWYDIPSDEMTLEQARQAVKDLRKKLTEYLEQEPAAKNYLSEEDILELKHRYGDEVEFVVKDMLTGEGKRWDKLPSTEPQVEIDNKKTIPWYLEPFKQAIEILGSNNTLEWLGKNCKDLGVDAISRAQTQTEIEMNASRYTIAKERGGMGQVEWSDQLIKVSDAVDIIRHLPSVAPQEPQTFKWCTTCKEYDQEKHCCHRWSKVIRDTVEEMKKESVIDKIRAEIEEYKSRQLALAIGVEDLEEGKQIALEYVLAILDKYKADVEPQEVRNK